jgi:hypothetical protein
MIREPIGIIAALAGVGLACFSAAAHSLPIMVAALSLFVLSAWCQLTSYRTKRSREVRCPACGRGGEQP